MQVGSPGMLGHKKLADNLTKDAVPPAHFYPGSDWVSSWQWRVGSIHFLAGAGDMTSVTTSVVCAELLPVAVV